MPAVTHLWQVTNELANPFGQLKHTLGQNIANMAVADMIASFNLKIKQSIFSKHLINARRFI